MKETINFIIKITLLLSLFNTNYFIYTNDNIKYIEINNNIDNNEKIIPIVDITSYISEYDNEDIIAYLNIPNSNIKAPVAKYTDNDYYLKHNLYKKNSIFGAIFMDYRVNFYDKKILIYGHNAQNVNTLFTNLEQYYKEEYYKEHNIIELTGFNSLSRYQIFSVFIEAQDWSYMNLKFNNDTWLEHLQMLKDKSWYKSDIELTKDDEIIIIQTCSFHEDYKKYKDKYLLIIGKKIYNSETLK